MEDLLKKEEVILFSRMNSLEGRKQRNILHLLPDFEPYEDYVYPDK